MALIYSLAETINIGWSLAASKAAGSLDDRVQDLAFRREVLAVVRDELGHSRLPTARELSKLLDDASFFTLAVDPDNPSARTAASQLAVGDAFEALDDDARGRLLSLLAASVAAVALRSTDPAIRLLNAKLDDVTTILLTLLDTQPDLAARVDQALEASGPLVNQPIWMSNQQLSGGLKGRDDDLAWLDGIDHGVVVLHAIGGAGKTQLALHHGGRQFAGLEVFALIPASNRSQLSSGFLALARRLGLPSPPGVHPDESVAALKDWLAATSQWLLVFDAAVDIDEIAPFLPTRVAGQLIITTTSPLGWGRMGEVRAIEPLAKEAAVQLLCEISGQSPGSDAEDLAEHLDRWPLPLVQAASFCRSTGTSLRDFRSLCDAALTTLLGDEQTAPVDHPATTVATVGLAFEAVRERSPAAAHLLELCCAAGQAPIGLRLFAAPELIGGALGDVVADPMELARVVAEARRFSLMERAGDDLVMHRVVRELLRRRMDDGERLKRLNELVGLLRASLPDDVQNPTTWHDWTLLVEHVKAVGEQLEALEDGGVALGVLLDRLATYLENQWDLDAAIRWFESSIAHLQRIDAPADTILGVRSNHANCMMKVDAAEAEALFLELLEAHREVHGDAALSMSGYADVEQALGLLARDAGQLDAADSYLLSALATYSRAIPENEWFRSKAVCDCLNNLGLVKLDSLGPEAAIPQFERARHLNEAGDRPGEVARNLSNIGVAYHLSGDSEQAETSHRAALQLRIDLLGDEHPDTNLSRGEVASTLRQRASALMTDAATGQLVVELLREAVALDREALDRLQARPRARSATAHRLNGLGLDLLDLYRATGSNDADLAEQAEASLKAAVELRAQSEPHTAGAAQSMTNLGRLYMATGQRSEARETFRRAIALLRQRGGAPTIPEALAHHWLAQIAVQDDPSGDELHRAIEHGDRSLDIYQALTGPRSASTRRAEEALANYRRMLDRLNGA